MKWYYYNNSDGILHDEDADNEDDVDKEDVDKDNEGEYPLSATP
jgi:hypothetical protein